MTNLNQIKRVQSTRLATVVRTGAWTVIVLSLVVGLIVVQALRRGHPWVIAVCVVPAWFAADAVRNLIALRKLERLQRS